MTDTAARDEMLSYLRSIDATLKSLLALSKSKRAAPAQPQSAVESMSSLVATDAELDSEYGDEPVKFAPRNWTGEFTKGQRMSACSPEFLDQLAAAHDWFAQKNEKLGDMAKVGYEQRSARRARGWSARLRSGWKPKAIEEMVGSDEMNW